MPAEINRLQAGRDDEGDCGVTALSCYLGVSYNEVLRAASVVDREQGRGGLWRRTMQRVAAHLGHPLVQRRTFDPDASYGVVATHEHAAVLREGWVLDRDTLWPWEAWATHHGVEVADCVLLVARE